MNPDDPNQNQPGSDQPTAPTSEPAQPSGSEPTQPSVGGETATAEQKCVTCGNASSGGNCVACGQGEVTCTCPPKAPEAGSAPGAPAV